MQTTLDEKGRVNKEELTAKTAPKYSKIPQELKVRCQWVVWKLETGKKGKLTKVPYNPAKPERLSSTTNPKTWGTFEQAIAVLIQGNEFSGIGYVFSKDDPYTGIDFDKCRDLATDQFKQCAAEKIKRLSSFTELSPSGCGVHILVKGILPPTGRKMDKVEMYDSARFFTMTGNHLLGTPPTIEDRQAELEALHREIFGEIHEKVQDPEPTRFTTPFDFSDAEIIAMAREARNGDKFVQLIEGNINGYPSQNEADLALCDILAYWTQKSPEQMDSMFRQSGLMRKKWDRRTGDTTYGAMTIDKAIRETKDVYKGPRSNRDNGGKRPMSVGKERVYKAASSDGIGPQAQAQTTPNRGKIISLKVPYELTDMGNAQRLVARHGENLRCCYPWVKWLVWDGARWRKDDTGEVERMGKTTVRGILAEAQAAKNDDKSKELAQFALKCQAGNKRRAMIESARSELGIPILPDDLDRDPWLLNVVNGTLDLRTGKLEPHRKKALITKLAPVKYEPMAECPDWWKFLERIFNRDFNLIRFLQRAVGYTLTGSTSEQCLFFLYGLGANGKTTFLNIIRAMLGDYARQTSSETFMVKRGEQISCDIADLKGARFVAAAEVENGRRLAEVAIKQVTGGDRVKARFLYGQPFEYDPEYKIFLAANHKPIIRGTDPAIWRRIHLIPFMVQIPKEEQDRELPEKLKTELSGILNWAIEGCINWQKHGLNPPQAVQAATQTYRQEMDTLADFLMECCIVNPEAQAMAAQIYKSYVVWADEAGEKRPLSQKELGTQLRERGFKNVQETKGENKGKIKWIGIGLRN